MQTGGANNTFETPVGTVSVQCVNMSCDFTFRIDNFINALHQSINILLMYFIFPICPVLLQ